MRKNTPRFTKGWSRVSAGPRLGQGLLAVVSAVLAWGASMPVQAQDKYPTRAITIIVPTSPGGSTDTVIRQLAEITSGILKQPFVILNRPGAGGMIGTSAIVRAEPDGYTLGGIWNAPLTMTPHTLKAQYSPDDYVAVSLSDSAPIVLCTKANFPANTGIEFVEYAKENPDKLTYGTDGVGATIQLASERIFTKLGIKLRSVPFAGAGQTLQSFLSNQIDVYGGSIAPIMPYVKDKTVKCLILSSVNRVEALPHASSLTDLGIPEVQTLLWHGIIAPKGVSADRLKILEDAFRKAAQTREFRTFLASQSINVEGTSAKDMRKTMDDEYAAMEHVAKALGLIK
ncbi:MAG TPA: tripartite tricarboxylate transporter substrate binding protein [Bordetella sp.]|nr:tripartite tricarboxylate transporter substrate binding protein [Bordetella sp.]